MNSESILCCFPAMPKFKSEKFRKHVIDNRGNLSEMELKATMPAVNLVDLLRKKQCINKSQKRFIDQQLAEESIKKFLVDLLIDGCWDVIDTVACYFRDTRQVELYKLLDQKYTNIGIIKSVSCYVCPFNKILDKLRSFDFQSCVLC